MQASEVCMQNGFPLLEVQKNTPDPFSFEGTCSSKTIFHFSLHMFIHSSLFVLLQSPACRRLLLSVCNSGSYILWHNGSLTYGEMMGAEKESALCCSKSPLQMARNGSLKMICWEGASDAAPQWGDRSDMVLTMFVFLLFCLLFLLFCLLPYRGVMYLWTFYLLIAAGKEQFPATVQKPACQANWRC